jgi:hypothetical protein
MPQEEAAAAMVEAQKAPWLQIRLDCLVLKHFVLSSTLQGARNSLGSGHGDTSASRSKAKAGVSAFALCKKRKQQAAAGARSEEVATALQVRTSAMCFCCK